MRPFLLLVFCLCNYWISAQQVNPQWVENIGTRFIEDRPAGIANDASGNVYVAGTTNQYPDANIFLVKLSSSGKQLWKKNWQTTANNFRVYETSGVNIDPAGNIFVTAAIATDGGIFQQILLLKYDKDGTVLGTQYETPPYRDGLDPEQTIIDQSGNIFVGGLYERGQATDTSTTDAFVVKFDNNLTKLWRHSVDFNHQIDQFGGLAVDQLGSCYILTGFDSAFFLRKYQSNGTFLMYRTFSQNNNQHDARGVDVDNQGNIYLTGTIATNRIAALIIKLNSLGYQQWVVVHNLFDTRAFFQSAIDTAGNSYITGATKGSTQNNYNILTGKFNTSGQLVWSKEFDNGSSSYDKPGAIAVDKGGNVYVAGGSGTIDSDDEYPSRISDMSVMLKYNTQGKLMLTAKHSGDFSNPFMIARFITLHQPAIGSPGIYVVNSNGPGQVNPPKYQDVLVLKYLEGGFPIGLSSTLEDAGTSLKGKIVTNAAPNPFRASTLITFDLPEEGFVSIKIYDAVGQALGTLESGMKSAGRHNTRFYAGHFAAQQLFYRLEVKTSKGSFVKTNPLIVLN
jgi:hypothetical protein